MTRVEEIEKAVARLSPDGLATVRKGFANLIVARRHAQLEDDVAAGKLDGLGAGALADRRDERSTEL